MNLPGIAGNFEVGLQTEFSVKRETFLSDVGVVYNEEFTFQGRL